jgi:hypothetical protein
MPCAIPTPQPAEVSAPADLRAEAAVDPQETEFRDQIVAGCIEDLRRIAAHPALVDAVVEANKSARKSQGEILATDKAWRQATSADDPLIAPLMNNTCAQFLKQAQKDQSSYSELFVMDNQGCIVAESNKTSDYWQGDEAKWSESFHGGQGRAFIDDIEYDQSSQAFVVQISLPVNAPGGATIGALTVSVMARKQP